MGVPRIVFYPEAPPTLSEAAHIVAEVPTDFCATTEPGAFNTGANPPTPEAGANSSPLRQQLLKVCFLFIQF